MRVPGYFCARGLALVGSNDIRSPGTGSARSRCPAAPTPRRCEASAASLDRNPPSKTRTAPALESRPCNSNPSVDRDSPTPARPRWKWPMPGDLYGKSGYPGRIERTLGSLRRERFRIGTPNLPTFIITGTGQLQVPKEPLFLGNAGTATRFLTAAAALVEGAVTVTGDAHMQKRPIGQLISAMRALGIEVEAPSGCPPVTVLGRGSFDGTRVVIDGGLSSQYVSALLMLAPGARHPIEVALDGDVIGARGYIDLTCAAMRHFGVHV